MPFAHKVCRTGPPNSPAARPAADVSSLSDSMARAASVPPPPPPGLADKEGKGLQKAAKDAFQNMDWQHLDAQAR